MKARGKRRAERGASPLGHKPNEREALKERNNYDDISHLQCSLQFDICQPGATRFALLSACPWLSYFAPLALRLSGLRLFVQGCNIVGQRGPGIQIPIRSDL